MPPEFSIEVQANENGYLAELDYGQLQIAPMEDTSFTPGQLLVSSTAACSGIVFGMIATKMRLPIDRVRIKANAKRNLEEAMRVESIHLHYVITGQGLRESAVEQAISLAFKNCPTVQSIKDAVEIVES